MRNREVFLVDDDDAVRHALRLYLEHSDLNVRDFNSGRALLEQIDAQDAGVLVTDLRMDEMSGLDLQGELKARGVELPVIFISGHGSIKDSVLAMKAGAHDFIEKPFKNEVLLESIRRALQAGALRGRSSGSVPELKKRFASLTPREQQTMKLVLQGTSNREIARLLNLSDRTVEVHRSRVMRKMCARNLPELVRMSVSLGISEVP